MEALERFGYTGRAGRKLEDIEQNVRRMLRRARLNRVETEMVLGMVRQALWRLEHP
jgi:tRNA C32,U32 (ribose-2'-O)-methylase TrmJ